MREKYKKKETDIKDVNKATFKGKLIRREPQDSNLI